VFWRGAGHPSISIGNLNPCGANISSTRSGSGMARRTTDPQGMAPPGAFLCWAVFWRRSLSAAARLVDG
jgi:hypothetical protein